LGGTERIWEKVQFFYHQELVRKHKLTSDLVDELTEEHKDLFGRKDKTIVPIDSSFPKYTEELTLKYPYLTRETQ